MIRKSLLLAGIFALSVVGARAQEPAPTCTMTWLGHNQEFEELLRTADVVSVEDVGMGVTHPKKVVLKKGDLTFKAAFKPISRGRHKGFWESYEAEVAAYEVDKLLGLNMVPPTIVRRIGPDNGSLQLWVENCKLYKEMMNQPPPNPVEWSHQLSRMKMFDNLIKNQDRNAQNFLVDPDWHIVLIDHSRAFISGKKIEKEAKKLPTQFDRALVEKMKSLSLEELDSQLKDLLFGGLVKDLIGRRDDLLDYLNKLVAKNGEAQVLF